MMSYLSRLFSPGNRSLAREIGDRERAQTALRDVNAELERSVALRTAELEEEVARRERSGEAVRESEQQWRQVFEHNPVMYFMVDAAGIILSVNALGASQLGYTVSELVGKS